MKDFILEISFDTDDAALDERLQSLIFLTASTGSIAIDGFGFAVYFDSPADRESAKVILADLPLQLSDVDRERVDWLDLYQQSLEPITIGKSFVVAPDVALFPRDSDRHHIVVPQEQAFGTGSHETTSLCIELLEELDLRDRSGLDIGAGSGILAIAMHRLGARKVIAFDNDVDAYGALRDNRVRNAVAESELSLFIGSVESLRAGRFDVITMNIIPEVILPLLGSVVPRLAGSLLLSGILTERRDEVLRACAARGLALHQERTKGEWWAGVLALAVP